MQLNILFMYIPYAYTPMRHVHPYIPLNQIIVTVKPMNLVAFCVQNLTLFTCIIFKDRKMANLSYNNTGSEMKRYI